MSDEHQRDKNTSTPPIESDGAPFFYANVVQMNIGPYDVTMDFGYNAVENLFDAAASDEPTILVPQRVARITMSHGHAKSMIPLIAKLIANLEENVGSIPTPGFDERSKE